MTASGPVEKVNVVHALLQFLAWGIFAPVGIYVMRYQRHRPYWLSVHKTCMSVSVLLSGMGGVGLMFSSGGELETEEDHVVIGVCILVVMGAQALMGSLVRMWHTSQTPPYRYGLLRKLHSWNGKALYTLCLVNLYFGHGEFHPDTQVVVILYIVLVVLGFIVAEIVHRKRTTAQSVHWPSMKTVKKIPPSRMRELIETGRKLVLLKGRVIDVADFLKIHPGGEYLLGRCLGRDISHIFEGRNSIDPRVARIRHSFRATKLAISMTVAQLSYEDTDEVPFAHHQGGTAKVAPVEAPTDATGKRSRYLVDPEAETKDTSDTEGIDPIERTATIMTRSGALRKLKLSDKASKMLLDAKSGKRSMSTWTVVSRYPITFKAKDPTPVTCLQLAPPPDCDFSRSSTNFGRFFYVVVPKHDTEEAILAPYSLCRWGPSDPYGCSTSMTISLIVRSYKDGFVSSYLSSLQSGSLLTLSPLAGLGFRLPPRIVEPNTLLLLTQGTGIVGTLDLIRMVAHESSKAAGRFGLKVILVTAFGSPDRALCVDWLQEQSDLSHGNFEVHHVMNHAPAGWREGGPRRYEGEVSTDIIKVALDRVPEDKPLLGIYVVGNSEFNNIVGVQLLPKVGVALSSVFYL